MGGKTKPFFHEEQSFVNPADVPWPAIPPLAMLLLAIWHSWGKQPMSNASVVGWTIFLWLIDSRAHAPIPGPPSGTPS
jgi:hypothetical protein